MSYHTRTRIVVGNSIQDIVFIRKRAQQRLVDAIRYQNRYRRCRTTFVSTDFQTDSFSSNCSFTCSRNSQSRTYCVVYATAYVARTMWAHTHVTHGWMDTQLSFVAHYYNNIILVRLFQHVIMKTKIPA